ncbi:MAG: stage II sporulation protein M [Candidatus Woesearchaeota archaeon]
MIKEILNPKYDESHEFTFFIFFFLTEFILLLVFLIISFLLKLNNLSLLIIFIITLLQVPFAYKILSFEELRELRSYENWKLHYRAIGLFSIFFFSTTLAVVLIQIFFPNNTLFLEQKKVIDEINNIPTGNFYNSMLYLQEILSNNFRVMFLSLIASILIGAGSLWILNWNASVLGFAIGSAIYDLLRIKEPFYVAMLRGTLKYLLHGVPEIMAYVISAFAGGLIFTAVINHHINTKVFKKVLYDASELILISCILLLIAGIIETFISGGL